LVLGFLFIISMNTNSNMKNVLFVTFVYNETITIILQILTPKGLTVPIGDKPVLGSATWSHFIFIFFETFCEHVPQNKLCGSTNFIIFRPINQKSWRNKTFRRSLGKADMYYSQPTRIDQMCKKKWVGRRELSAGGSLSYLCRTGGRPLVDWLAIWQIEGYSS
jgi:hypothetical protein